MLGKKAVRSPGKQCLVDKYVITFQNISGKEMVRTYLVELGYSKILRSQKKVRQAETITSYTKNIF